MAILLLPFRTIGRHIRLYVLVNVVLYGLMLCVMALTMFFPEWNRALIAKVQASATAGSAGPSALVDQAYLDGDVLVAGTVTFLFNLVGGSLLATVPSLIVPFVGLGLLIYRFVLWGVIFAPVDGDWGFFFVHGLTVVIEGQAYVLTALAIVIHSLMWLRPKLYGFPSRRAGYVAGLKATVAIYALVVVALLIGGFYEAFEIIHILPAFDGP
jgi:hypothetical protein